MQQEHRQRRRVSSASGRAVLGALCVVALLLAGKIGALGHLLLVKHTRCAHGELVHTQDLEAHRTVAAEPDSDIGGEALQQAHADHHEHCKSLAVTELATVLVRPPALVQLLAWELLLPAGRPATARAAIDLLALAPKTSPPPVA